MRTPAAVIYQRASEDPTTRLAFTAWCRSPAAAGVVPR